MNALPFRMPSFSRLAWVSDEARGVWGPRIASVASAREHVEWLSVRDNIRRCCITSSTPEKLVENSQQWIDAGLSFMPISRNRTNGIYSNSAEKPVAGERYEFRIVIGRSENLSLFKEAWDESDDEAIGDLLGYPQCCQRFFKKVWCEKGLRDTSWEMVREDQKEGVMANVHRKNDDDWMCNILWRWAGPRAVSHLPCSFACDDTKAVAQSLIDASIGYGYGQEMKWLQEILQWPVEWSGLHGIGIIKTPIFKIVSDTDATANKFTIRVHGSSYPEEGGKGLDFPYRSNSLPILKSQDTLSADAIAEQELSGNESWYRDNGFASRKYMDAAHSLTIDFLFENFADLEGDVLDLGCGNGVLLGKIFKKNSALIPNGVDVNNEAIRRAKRLHSSYSVNFMVENIFDTDKYMFSDGKKYSLAILMAGRLAEVSVGIKAAFIGRLCKQCDNILVYLYADWAKSYGNLEATLRNLNLPVKKLGDGNVGL